MSGSFVRAPLRTCEKTSKNFAPRESRLALIVGSRSWWQTKAASFLLAPRPFECLAMGNLATKAAFSTGTHPRLCAPVECQTSMYMLLLTGWDMVAILFWHHSAIPTSVCMRSSDHLGDAKMSKRAPHFVEFIFLTNRNRREQFSQNEKRRADLQKVASSFVFFCPRT